MSQFKTSGTSARPGNPLGEDSMLDFRARMAHQQAEATERRRADLADQSSGSKSAEERIRIWERIHEVNLPRDAAHNLVPIIAANTGLTRSDVQHEQDRRAALRAAHAAGTR